jgi:hypothetical protein
LTTARTPFGPALVEGPMHSYEVRPTRSSHDRCCGLGSVGRPPATSSVPGRRITGRAALNAAAGGPMTSDEPARSPQPSIRERREFRNVPPDVRAAKACTTKPHPCHISA